MIIKSLFKKLVFLMLIFMSFASVTSIGYSYWDNLDDNKSEAIAIGDWGTLISTAQEFYDFATNANSLSTDAYYLVNDIDFTGFTWNLDATNSDITFRGNLIGNGHTISNLTIFTDNSSYSNIGIFSHIEGGLISNVIFDNVNISIGSALYSSTSLTAGLIAGDAIGGTTTLDNITIINSGVAGTSASGVGGLIGNINGSTAIVNVSNIKAANLKIFNISSTVGGLIGQIDASGAQLNISDIDIQADVFSNDRFAYAGGIIGNISAGAAFSLSRAIIDISMQNTLITDNNYLTYSQKYVGGLIGQNQSDNTLVNIDNVFLTGSIFVDGKRNEDYADTAIGREKGSEVLTNGYYSYVEFRSSNGSPTYTPVASSTGVPLTLVNDNTSLPTLSWWNTFAAPFLSANSLWSQDGSGRLYLLR